MSFESHINAKVKKANQMMGLIRRVFSFLGKDMFLRLYTAFVRSHLEFSQVVWAPWKKRLIRTIESIQERATAQVDGLSRLNYADRLKALGLTTLSFRRIRGDMIEVWKHFNVYAPGTVPATFRRVERGIRASTRHPLQLYPNIAKDGAHGLQSNSFYYRTTARWNKLPTEVVTAETLNSFKNRFDKYIERHHNELRYTTIIADDEEV